MRRPNSVRRQPIRQGSSGTQRVRVIVVADGRVTGHGLHARLRRMVRRELDMDASVGKDKPPDVAAVVPAPNPLSVREREVLGMLARGLRNKEIAALLFIADRTVKFHAQSIYRKLDVANRTEAVSVALRRGIVALDQPMPPASDAA